METKHNCGFSWPATKATVRLSKSCLSFHWPHSVASNILCPSPPEDAVGCIMGLCSWLCTKARLSSCLNRLTTWRALIRLGKGSRSNTGKFMKIGLKISRLTAV